MIVWLDLETTGLDPERCDILELAAIITDDALNEVARMRQVIYSPMAHAVLERNTKPAGDNQLRFYIGAPVLPDPTVIEMHTVNGLWNEVPTGYAIATADRMFASWLKRYSQVAELHYRNIDVTSINQTTKRFFPAMYAARPNNETKGHRAMADVEESLRVYKFYINAFKTMERDARPERDAVDL